MVGCGKCLFVVVIVFIYLFILTNWAVERSVCVVWLQLWSETQRTLLVVGEISPSAVYLCHTPNGTK